jgi:ferredoxin
VSSERLSLTVLLTIHPVGLKNMAQEDKENIIDQPEVIRHKMVSIEIAGKKYDVPEGITIIKALWYSGQEVVRGAGCLGGFCGACAAYCRTKDDPKVRTCLACQMAVQDGMSITMMLAFPARKATPLSRMADLEMAVQD